MAALHTVTALRERLSFLLHPLRVLLNAARTTSTRHHGPDLDLQRARLSINAGSHIEPLPRRRCGHAVHNGAKAGQGAATPVH